MTFSGAVLSQATAFRPRFVASAKASILPAVLEESPVPPGNRKEKQEEIDRERRPGPSVKGRWLTATLLAGSFLLFLLHYVNLSADFPHYTWPDWARYHDEGWYAGAAIRQIFVHRWRLEGDFNPGAAIPVFPALAWVVFRVFGVGIVALHALNVTLFGATLATIWTLVRRYRSDPAAAGAVFLCACSPYYFAFSRLGIVEPLLVLEFLVALLVATYLYADRSGTRYGLPGVAIGVLLVLIVLTKASGLFLFPAVLYLMASQADLDVRRSAKPIGLALGVAGGLWVLYYELIQRLGYGGDFHHMFVVNEGHVHRVNFFRVLWLILRDTPSLGAVLFFSAIAAVLLSLLFAPKQSSLLMACILGAGGYEAFIIYHRRPEPHYFLLLLPLFAMALTTSMEDLTRAAFRPARFLPAVFGALIAISSIGDMRTILIWAVSPSFSYVQAARAVYSTIDGDPSGNRVVLGRPGEEVALLASESGVFVTDEFGAAPLRGEIVRYRPGWLLAFDEIPSATRLAVQGLYSLNLVRSVPAYGDDWAHHRLLLYKLTPPDPAPGR